MGKKKEKGPVVEYWHGGAAGRAVGDLLIPGTDVPAYSQVIADMTKELFDQQRPDYVHITVDRNLAIDYAILNAKFGAAALYRVKPLGPLEGDPDYPQGVSHRCSRALVLSVEPDVITSETPDTGAHLGYSTWADDSPLYDSDGYPLPNKMHQHFGVKASHLRSLGYGADFEAIEVLCRKTMFKLNPTLKQQDFLAYKEKPALNGSAFFRG
jgi:hypothetical protein